MEVFQNQSVSQFGSTLGRARRRRRRGRRESFQSLNALVTLVYVYIPD